MHTRASKNTSYNLRNQPQRNPRKPVQLATFGGDGTEHRSVIVLCDDASLWMLDCHEEWRRLPDIPQE